MTEKSKRDMKNEQKVALLAALVAAYGEGAVVTRKQLMDVWSKNKSKFAHIVTVRKNPAYKAGRNLFVVTASEDPASVRDAVLAERQAKGIPADLKKNPLALAMAIKDGMSKAEKAPKKKSAKSTAKVEKTESGLGDFGYQDADDGQDIQDILRVMQ